MVNQNLRFMNARFVLPHFLTHLAIFGQQGSGKSQTLKNLIERTFLRGDTKIFDLYSAGSEEGCWYALKSNHNFWKDRSYEYRGVKIGAQEFPVKCLIPMCKGLPNELPDFFSVFTIPINGVSEFDLKSILGNELSKNEQALWRKVNENINKETTLIDLLNLIMDERKRNKSRIPGISGHGISSIYNMFNGLEREKIFSKYNNELSLDLLSELRNKKIITSLNLRYFPNEYYGFIINYFIRNIYNIMLSNKIKHNVVIVMREAGDFLENFATSSQEIAVKESIIQVVRKGRKSMLWFWIDNQNPLTLDVVKSEFPIKICHKVDNTVELKDALGDLGSMLLVKDDYNRLLEFTPGKCFVLTPRGLFCSQILPPMSMMSGIEGNDFETVWRNEKGNRFIKIKDKIELIENEYIESELKWKNAIKNRKMKVRERRENIQKEKERIEEEKRAKLDEEKLQQRILRQQERELEKLNRERLKMRSKPKIRVKRDIRDIVNDDIDENNQSETSVDISNDDKLDDTEEDEYIKKLKEEDLFFDIEI